MGSSCTCIQSKEHLNELQIDTVRLKEISKIFFILAKKIKSSPSLLYTLTKMQARLKGLIVRNRIRSVKCNSRINNGKDTSSYTYCASTKIVF